MSKTLTFANKLKTANVILTNISKSCSIIIFSLQSFATLCLIALTTALVVQENDPSLIADVFSSSSTSKLQLGYIVGGIGIACLIMLNLGFQRIATACDRLQLRVFLVQQYGTCGDHLHQDLVRSLARENMLCYSKPDVDNMNCQVINATTMDSTMLVRQPFAILEL